ncbi:DUF202 domain-containing protein [Photobacterium nomapromontoriensis]|uniref:DUF202 domain-containing protein n=1 Tax=Photobacterium nomapromontoriensis TaxID=2910237 RepID=UPI003D0AAC3C
MRDPGLQPERTEMSWLRTELVMCVVGIALIRVGILTHSLWLTAVGILFITFAVTLTYYSHIRFTQRFSNAIAVTPREVNVKRLLSTIIMGTNVLYILFLFGR